MRELFPAIILITLLSFIGCQFGSMGSLFKAQDWSENYARMEGTTCSTPEMIDGDMDTVGRSRRHEIIITLPELKSIHRIVIRGTNIEDFILDASTGSKGNWKRVTKLKNNRLDTIDIRVSVITNELRFRIGGTHDDKRMARVPSNVPGRMMKQIKRGDVLVKELELYGLADSKGQVKEDDEPLF